MGPTRPLASCSPEESQNFSTRLVCEKSQSLPPTRLLQRPRSTVRLANVPPAPGTCKMRLILCRWGFSPSSLSSSR